MRKLFMSLCCGNTADTLRTRQGKVAALSPAPIMIPWSVGINPQLFDSFLRQKSPRFSTAIFTNLPLLFEHISPSSTDPIKTTTR